MSLAFQLRRLGRHSAIYGLGGLVSRVLATILLPLYTHYLPPRAYGQVEIVTAATAVLAIVLQMGIASAFFRFYFDAKEQAEKLTVVRTSFWFTMTAATVGLVLGLVFAAPIAHWIGLGHAPWLVRAGAVGLWAQTNYQQLTALFRVEERSTAYAIASVANVLVTVAAMVVFVAGTTGSRTPKPSALRSTTSGFRYVTTGLPRAIDSSAKTPCQPAFSWSTTMSARA